MEDQTSKPRPPSSTTSNNVVSDKLSSKRKSLRKLKSFTNALFKMDKGKWLEDMRGNLSMVATLISAITFQAALNPPGGMVQASTGPEHTLIGCNTTTGLSVNQSDICTGEAVLGVVYSGYYLIFIKCNTFSFVGSLSAALLLVSGIPLRHRFPMWFLSIAMSASLTSLAMTYLVAVIMVTPHSIFGEMLSSFRKFMLIWIGLLLLIILFITIRFLVWFVKKGRKLFKSLKNKGNNTLANPENNVP